MIGRLHPHRVAVAALIAGVAAAALVVAWQARPRAVVRVTFVGDTALRLRGPREPVNDVTNEQAFAHVRDALGATDFLVGNLETPILSAPLPARGGHPLPRQLPDVLGGYRDAGFFAFSLANNHSMDFGAAGLAETQRQLGDLGMATFGAGADLEAAGAPLILEREGLRIGVLAGVQGWRSSHARRDRPGNFPFTNAGLRDRILAIRDDVDVVVVYPHWGENFKPVSDAQRRLARVAAAAGADLVIGHHAHMAQTVEIVDGVPVLYSIGNFVFHGVRTSGSLRNKDREYSLVAAVDFDQQGVSRITLTPFFSNNTLVEFVPQPVTEDSAQALFDAVLAPIDGLWSMRGVAAVIEPRLSAPGS